MAVTVRDIAKHCGVGRTAVSLALRGAPGVGATTRARVLASARELGYVADPMVGRLAERRWRRGEPTRLAFVKEAGTDQRTFAGVREEAMRAGYHAEVFFWGGELSPERLGTILRARGFEAVLLDKVTDPGFLRRFPFASFMTVSLSVGMVRMPVHQVRLDNLRTVEDAYRRCRERGYRRIGLLLFDEWSARDLIERRGAFLDAQEEARQKETEAEAPYLLVPPGENSDTDLRQWVERYRPDVVIGLNFSLYWRLRKLGYRIPEDMAFLGLVNPVRKASAFAWYDAMDGEVVRTGLWLMDRLFRQNERGIPQRRMKILLDQAFVDGESFPMVDSRPEDSIPVQSRNS